MDASVVDNNSNFTNTMYLWNFEALLSFVATRLLSPSILP